MKKKKISAQTWYGCYVFLEKQRFGVSLESGKIFFRKQTRKEHMI